MTRFLLLPAILFCVVTMDAQVERRSDSAGDQSVKSTALAEPFSWTGFYVGGNLGWNWSKYDVGSSSETALVTIGQPPFPSVTADVSGFALENSEFLGGGQLGYNHQFGQFVIGFEGDFGATSLSGSNVEHILTLDPFMDFDEFVVKRSVRTDWMASARLRAGIVTWERLLLYGTGGAAFTKVNVETLDNFFGPFLFQSASDDAPLIGWTAGVGAEWAVMKAVSLGVEYRHSDFGDKNFDLASPGSSLSAHSTNVGFTDDQVTLRVNLLFSGLFGR